MNNVFVYCEIEGTQVQEVSQELLTKGRKLANQLNVELHAVVAVLTSFSCSTHQNFSLTLQLLTQTSWLTSSRKSSHRFASWVQLSSVVTSVHA